MIEDGFVITVEISSKLSVQLRSQPLEDVEDV
jgi:hypothetical protein